MKLNSLVEKFLLAKKLYMFINSKWFQFILIGLILALSFGLMLGSSVKESAIMDELAHIPAGYGYVHELDYRLNPEHPPLIKIAAALPLLFFDLNFPTDHKAWTTDINGQWEMGDLFMYQSGNNADTIVNWSRLGPIFLTLILILFVYFWSKELMGKWWALLPTVLTALSPTVLAHGHYVTTDIGAALGVFVAMYSFTKMLQNPTKKNLFWAGIGYGVAQLMKFSAILLIPTFILLVIAIALYRGFRDHYSSFGKKSLRFLQAFGVNTLRLIGVFIIGYLLVYLVYIPITLNYPSEKQHYDTETILTSFADGPDPTGEACKLGSDIPAGRRIRCLANVTIAMTENPITKPFAQYMLGLLMVIQRATGGNYGYFMGEVSSGGWWYYFPAVFFFKEPIPSLLLIAFAFLLGLKKFILGFRSHLGLKNRFINYLGVNFSEFSMLLYVVIYWAYSMKSPLNIGVRHVLPTIPLLYILSAQSIKYFVKNRFEFVSGFMRNFFHYIAYLFKSSLKTSILLILIIWYAIEAFATYPYFISYFNELNGGVFGGYTHAVDSNYDWGQDMKRLDKFIDGNKIDKIAVNYFGGENPTYRNPAVVKWDSPKGDPREAGINWFAISINNLQGSINPPRILEGGNPEFVRKPEDAYMWITEGRDPYKPDYRLGTTMFVYKLK